MKKIITLLSTLVLMLSIAVSVAISSSAAGTSIANATQIYMGTTYNDSITETGREDYYKFKLSSAGRVSIDITSYMQYYCLVIYNSAGEELWYTDYNEWISTTGMRKDNHKIDLTAGTYYLKANGYRNLDWYASTGNYSFKVTFTSAKETKSEPNDSIAEASALNFNTLTNGQIAINDRNDYYKIILPSAGRISIDITSYMQYYCLVIYNTAGEELWYTDYNEWISTTGMRKDNHKIDLTAGTYYLKANGYRNSDWYASTGNYSFKVTFASAYETKLEPNNSIVEASILTLGSSVKGQIATNDRNDYFKINISNNCTININITSYMQYYCIIIYDLYGKEIWYTDYNEWASTSGKRTDTHKIDLSKGTYYIKVNGYRNSDWYASTGNYTISIKEFIFVPKVDKIKVSSESTASHTIKWSKTAGVTGYELYRYNSSTKKYEKIKTTSSTKYKTSGLKSGTTYKYKVRAYIKKNGTTHYGAFSSVLSAGTKPAKTTLSSVKSAKPAQLTVTWKTVKGSSGYQVFCSTSKKFTSKTTKKVTVKKQSSKKTTVKKLKKGKKYYIRVRAYKTVGGKNLYGAYSAVKSAKVKR